MELNIKQAIADLTQKAGLTQNYIATETGCKQENISYHFHSAAKRPRPSYQLVNGLTRLLVLHADKVNQKE